MSETIGKVLNQAVDVTADSGSSTGCGRPDQTTHPLLRLWDIVRFDARDLGGAALFQVLQPLSYLPFYAGVGILVDRILQNKAATIEERYLFLLYYALANLGLWPIHMWCTVGCVKRSQRLMRSAVAQMRRLLVDKLQRMSLSFFTRRGAGALSNQVTTDLGRVEAFLANVVGSFLIQVTLGLGALAYMFWLNPLLASVTAMAIPLQFMVVRRMRKRLDRLNQNVQQSGESFSARVVEFIGGMRVTKSMGSEERVAGELAEVIERVRGAGLEASVAMCRVAMAIQMIGEYFGVVVWCLGGVLYLQGKLPLGSLLVFTGTFGFVRGSFQAFVAAYDSWMQAKPGLVAMLAILDSEELESFRHAHGVSRVRLKGELQLRDVSFRYPGIEGAPTLSDISLHIPAGQHVGLVGETGAGKSTLIDLILGFYIPNHGQILYDGRRLEDIGLLELRRNVAIMGQESFLWNTTVRENIRLGRPTATDAEVEQAAGKAQADRFIRALERGYETMCGERGGRLSGGQRQRVALARVFLRNPSIVILDEPTSALDLETEALLQDDLDTLCRGITTFIVAHRLSTLRSVDRVLVFKQGRIVEDGRVSELLANEAGHFARLTRLQTRGLGKFQEPAGTRAPAAQ
jgi:ABC-type multidrug transport system fused ATPase/permease subunit